MIESLAAQLQRLPADMRWLATNMQAVVEGCARNGKRQPGPREKQARRLLSAASRFGLERPVATFGGLLLLLWTWLSQFGVRVERTSGPIFVGMGALREPGLERRFASIVGRPGVKIDERQLSEFFRFGRVPLAALVSEFSQVRKALWRGVAVRSPLNLLPWIDTVSFYLMRGYQYAYLRAWFRQFLQARGASRYVACTTPGSPAYAAVAAGADVTYMPHGFQAHSLIYADFKRCICFTGFEAEHIAHRLPNCAVELDVPTLDRLDTLRVVAIAGTFGDPGSNHLIRPFIAWAQQQELPVVVRKHPYDMSGFWDEWRGTPGVEVVEAIGSFDDFLATVRPRFLAAWHSTVLFDCLLRGVIPISVNLDAMGTAIVYPIAEMTLRWPEDRQVVERLLDDARALDAMLSRLLARAVTHDASSANSAVA